MEAAVRRAEAHGPGADLESVYREHSRLVLRAAYRVTGNAQDAEDVLQTVFLRLARREGGSPLSDTPAHYLHRAAINAALDLVRSRAVARSTPLDDVEATLQSDSTTAPDRRQDGSEIRELVRRALGALSPKAAEIFSLRYLEGYDNHEIARMLGTSRSTVNVILHRSRHKVQEEIRGTMGDRS